MDLGISSMKNNLKAIQIISSILGVIVLLSACAGGDETTEIASTLEMTPTESVDSGDGRTIEGDEALELYGAVASPTTGPPTATPQIWFPAKAWVEPSILPYDSEENINYLPMFSNRRLEEATSLWLGDLEAGQEVILHGVTEDGVICLVEGETTQGWTAKGFVACNRLRFTEIGE